MLVPYLQVLSPYYAATVLAVAGHSEVTFTNVVQIFKRLDIKVSNIDVYMYCPMFYIEG